MLISRWHKINALEYVYLSAPFLVSGGNQELRGASLVLRLSSVKLIIAHLGGGRGGKDTLNLRGELPPPPKKKQCLLCVE